MLNKSYPSPASYKIIDDGVTLIKYHQHESKDDPVKAPALKVEDKAIVTDDSYAVGIVNDIKESNR